MNELANVGLFAKNPWQLPFSAWAITNWATRERKQFSPAYQVKFNVFKGIVAYVWNEEVQETEYLSFEHDVCNLTYTNLVLRPASLVDFLLSPMSPLRRFFVHWNTVAALLEQDEIKWVTQSPKLQRFSSQKRLAIAHPKWPLIGGIAICAPQKYSKHTQRFLLDLYVPRYWFRCLKKKQHSCIWSF